MPLEFRRQRDGRIRDTWFGAFEIDGKRQGINLGIKIAGTPPESLSLREEGDAAYERSRAAALAKLEQFTEEARTRSGSARLVERLYEIKTGETLRSVKLKELADEWTKLPRRRKPSARYLAQCQVTLKRFVAFMTRENAKADDIAHVTRAAALAFMDAEAKRGTTARTWNDTLSLLRTAFKALLPAGAINPFMAVPMRETETVFRMAFSPDELAAIAEAARADEFIRPILVTGMCTAMRRGDCCLLKWKDVDLERRFITVKTAKTRQMVSIPIFPLLMEELRGRVESGKQKAETGHGGTARRVASGESGDESPHSKGYVFPGPAQMYLGNPSGITWRVKKVLAVALGEKLKAETLRGEMGSGQRAEVGGQRSEGGEQKAGTALQEAPNEDLRKRGLEYVGGLPNGPRRERIMTVFNLYMDGQSLNEVAAEYGVSKGSVSGYLKEIEVAAGFRVVRGRADGKSTAARLKAQSHLLLAEREEGQRRASVRDFHSFRVTWVTLALTAGVPLELVQKVTGHKTTDIVLKHYFQPGREAFRQALQSAMPALLTSGSTGEDGRSKMEDGKRAGEMEEAIARTKEIIAGMTAKTWRRDRARLLKVWEG